ncbi:ABC transporter permease [bacterium]|nr:ABC transporter permease [bacterium]
MPDWRSEIQKYLNGLNLEPTRETEIIEEFSQHLTDIYDEAIKSGKSDQQGYAAAMEELTEGKLNSELCSILKPASSSIVLGEKTKSNLLSGLWKDLRYGARLLRLNPAFSIIAILSLSLGIGANAAIFQLIDAVRLRTLPVKDPQQLVEVKVTKSPHGLTGAFVGRHPRATFGIWGNIRNQQKAFTNVAAWGSDRLNLNQGGEARYADAIYTSGTFFETLGVLPTVGRLISNVDDQPKCAAGGLVISNSFWKREFGSNPSVIGRKMTLEGHPFEIVGVTPASFFGMEVGRNFDIAVPICVQSILRPEDNMVTNPQGWWLGVVGRLKPGWSIEKASAHFGSLSRGIFEATLPAAYDATDKKNYLELVMGVLPLSSGFSELRTQYENPLWLLMAISALVLLIACANLANLMFARATVRQREMAVRLALGASPKQLIRQLLAESALLAMIGAFFGVALSQVLSRLLVSFLSTERSKMFLDLHPDWRILAFATGLAILTCILFGLLPAIQAARTPPGEVMKSNSRSMTGGRERFSLRRALVISQVALSLVLLTGALLFVSTFRNLLGVDAGFRQNGILVARLDLGPLQLPAERRNSYKAEVLERIRTIPGVSSAASVAIVPLSGAGWNENINIPEATVKRAIANFNQTSPGYFQTMQTPFLSGRDFNKDDTVQAPPVAVVTKAFSKKFLNGKNPVGMTFRKAQQGGKPDRIYQIIGLVEDNKYFALREDYAPIIFVPEAQDEEPYSDLQIVIRSNKTNLDMIPFVKQVVSDINPSIVMNFRIFSTMVQEGLLRERLMATLSGFFGFLAAILAMIGLYGVISYMVTRRRNEIGIRMALGANKQSILSMIMREAAGLLGIGLVIGTILTLIAGTTARALLFGTKPTDPLTLLIAIAGLAAVAAAASLIPARRAAKLDPMNALREE